MKKMITLSLLAVCLLTPKLYADNGWETAGKILTGVVIGQIFKDVLNPRQETCRIPSPCPPSRRIEVRPSYYEYRTWIPGQWRESYAYEIVPGRYETRLVERLDGSFHEIAVWVPPSTRPVSVREWIPGRWETRIGRR